MSVSYYIKGLYLGDGCVSSSGLRKRDNKPYYRIRLVCSDGNLDEVLTGVSKSKIEKSKLSKDQMYTYYEVYSNDYQLSEELAQELGAKSVDKHYPVITTAEDFFELLSGLIDSDGTVNKDSVMFMNTNKTLISETANWLDMLHIGYSIYEDTYSKGIKYSLRISSKDLDKLKVNLRVSYKKERLQRIRSVNRGGYVEVDETFLYTYRKEFNQVYPKGYFNNIKRKDTIRIARTRYEQILELAKMTGQK